MIYANTYFDRISILTFLSFILENVQLTHEEVGSPTFIFFFASALGRVSAGHLADGIGSKKRGDWLPGSEKGRATAFFSSTWAVVPAIILIAITSIANATGSD